MPSDDRCIRGFTTALNWFEAEEYCTELSDLVTGENLGAHLVSIHSDTKNTQLVNYYQSLYSMGAMKEVFWAGAQRQGIKKLKASINSLSMVSSGGNQQVDGMEWTDGSDFTYMKWDQGEPSFEWNGHAEDCLSVKGSGFWNDDHCDTDRHGYICQIPRKWSGCQDMGIYNAYF